MTYPKIAIYDNSTKQIVTDEGDYQVPDQVVNAASQEHPDSFLGCIENWARHFGHIGSNVVVGQLD
jgi:hypothetical protein